MKKRIISLALAIAMLASICVTAAGAVGTPSLAAFGDSIAFGYGVEPEQAYPAVAAASLGMSVTNLAVNGAKTSDTLAAVKSAEGKKAIAAASVVTVSAGSNNGLVPLFAKAIEAFGLTEEDLQNADALEGLKDKISDQMTDSSGLIKTFNGVIKDVAPELEAGIADFKKEFPEIIAAIKAVNPNAQIVVNNLYNPFYGMKIPMVGFDLESPAENYILAINKLIDAQKDTLGYKVADIYNAFSKNKTYVHSEMVLSSVNFSKSTFNLDPHPTVLGHQKIAETVAAKIDKDALSAAVVPTETETTVTDAEWVSPFTDVKSGDWYYDAVRFANETGLMVGTTETTFEPNTEVSRAMVISVLYRVANATPVDTVAPYVDLESGTWYYDAVNWAYANGILENIPIPSDRLVPNLSATRQELATMLYNYASFAGLDISQGGMQIREFSDYDDIDEDMLTSLAWCVNTGIMTGSFNADDERVIDPVGSATRAVFAQMFKMFAAVPMPLAD